jgi:O-antigen ligase
MNFKNKLTSIVTIISCLLMAAFFISPALMSISLASLLLIGMVSFSKYTLLMEDKSLKPIVFASIAYFVILLISMFISDNQAEAHRKFILKLPIALMPLLFISFKKLTLRHLSIVVLVFVFFVYLTGTISSVVYLQNKEYFDDLILQAKPIPILFGYGIYHIQFSVLNALSVLVGFYFAIKNYSKLPFFISFSLLLFSSVNLLNLHILSARTGLFGFYLSLFVMVSFYGVKVWETSKKKFLLGLLLFLFLPVIFVFISPSLQNRIKNTNEDLQTITENLNPNDKSVAMRVEAWKTALTLLKNNPLGIGLGNVEEQMQFQYEKNKTLLTEQNRKNPHNQFLETALQMGIQGLFVFLVLLFLYFRYYANSPIGFAILSLFIFSFLVESMLERQVSIASWVFFIPFTHFLNKTE